MSLPGDASLSLDQAPPLSIPASFFLLAPVAIAAAGVLLLVLGVDPLESGGRPGSGALTHLGTLGLLGSVMLGALYQMIPVVLGGAVPAIRVAHAVHAAWTLGVTALVAGFLTGPGGLWGIGGSLLGAALVLFLVPVGLAMARASAQTATRVGMGFAVVGLLVVGLLGLSFVALRGAGWLPPGYHPTTWRIGHLGLGLAVWVGGLLTAVSWQVLPMFYLSTEIRPAARTAVTAAVGLSLLGVPIALGLGGSIELVLALLAPAGVAIWAAHPALMIPALRARRRKRQDESLTAWFGALVCAPATGLCAVAAIAWPSPRWDVAFVLLAVLGWGGLALHGMLCRVLPFLVWFHRLSPWIGKVKVPSMRKLLPQDRIRRGVLAHGVALGLLLLAAGTGSDFLARIGGLALLVTGVLLGANLVSVLRVRAPESVSP